PCRPAAGATSARRGVSQRPSSASSRWNAATTRSACPLSSTWPRNTRGSPSPAEVVVNSLHTHIARGLVSAALLVSSGTGFAADTATHSQLTLDGAHRAVAASLKYAREHDAPGGAIAVVDAGGHVILVERIDGTFPAGADISVGKARTSVMFKRPTKGIEDTINKGRDAMIPVAAVTWFTPLQGGIPITVNGEIVGGIGVSGASSAQQDEEIAIAGAKALETPAAAAVEKRSAAEVKAAFA